MSLVKVVGDTDDKVTQGAFRKLGEVLINRKSSGIGGITVEELKDLVDNLDVDDREKQLMLKVITEVDTDGKGKINVEEWVLFVDRFCKDWMAEGHINRTWHSIISSVDLFGVSTWHEFERYTQVSWLGASFGLLMRIAFLVAIVLGIIAFANEDQTSMRQEFVSNSYEAAEVSPFFFYFRAPSWENLLDPSLGTFEMSYYVKSLDTASGKTVEKSTPVKSRTVGPQDVPWWPASIAGIDKAVTTEQPVVSEGAYHLDKFQQLEVKFVACRNQTGGVICQSPEKIRAAVHGASVNFVVQSKEHGFDASRTQYWSVLEGETKQIDLWFDRQMSVITPKWPWGTEQKKSLLPYTMSTQQITPPWSDGTLAVWWFSQTPNAMIETRVRQTVIGLFGELGGTWASLLSVFGMVALWYNNRKLDQRVEVLRVRVRLVEDLRISARDLLASKKTRNSDSGDGELEIAV